ncbi:hypothetical protein WJX84_009319 [Apatococcus fuscideae]|uniref:Uncharacterized protein n=1 Tax=Apatococcus fuscideae TaxID=2026836 RepID=A0AAW1SSG7_9CHLO
MCPATVDPVPASQTHGDLVCEQPVTRGDGLFTRVLKGLAEDRLGEFVVKLQSYMLGGKDNQVPSVKCAKIGNHVRQNAADFHTLLTISDMSPLY